MPKIVNHDEYRAELLRKAFQLFARKGYSKVTIRELAKELGVSTGTLYHYFENKDVLFEQMVHLLANDDVAQLYGMEIRNKDQSTQVAIEVLFQFIYAKEFYFQSVILMVCDVYRYNEEGHKLSILMEWLNIYRNAITDHLQIENKDLVNMLLSILIGTTFQRMLDPQGVTFAQTSDMLQKVYPFLATGLLLDSKKLGNE